MASSEELSSEPLFASVVQQHGAVYPVYVDKFSSGGSAGHNGTMAHFFYGDAEDSVTALAERLALLSELAQMDLLFFGNGGTHNRLVRSLAADFFSGRISGYVMPTTVPEVDLGEAFRLQLNSRLFLYDTSKSGGGFDLSEIYRIRGGPMIRQAVGNWTAGSGLRIFQESSWDRRMNLRGVVLNNVVMQSSVLLELEMAKDGKIEGLSGIFYDILVELMRRLNFGVNLFHSEGGKFGQLMSDGKTWDGAIGMIINGTADMSSGGLSYTKERRDVVDFSIPLFNELVTLMSAYTQEKAVNFWVYVNVFASDIWLACAVSILSTTAAFSLVHSAGGDRIHEPADGEPFTALNSLGLSLMNFLNLTYPTKMCTAAGRVILLCSCIMSYLTFACYTSDLTAIMTAEPAGEMITSFADAHRRGYHVTVLQSGASHTLLKTAKVGSDRRKAFDDGAVVPVASYEEALGRMLADPRSLFFSDTLAFIRDPRIVPLIKLEDAHRGGVGFALRKGSEFTEMFNYHLYQMQERGVLDGIKKSWMAFAENSRSAYQNQQESSALGYRHVLFLFIVLVTGVGSGLAGLGLEVAIRHAFRSIRK